MAKKGNRIQVILECTEHKNQWYAWHVTVYHHQEQEEYAGENGIEKIQSCAEKGYSTS